MSPLPEAFLEHLRTRGYHSRSDRHSNALGEAIVQDLFRICPAVRTRTGAGSLVYALNFVLYAGTATWKVDLVVGRPPERIEVHEPASGIPAGQPATVEIAIEIKSVMTEHHKAIKNRKRGLEAHHQHVHDYSAAAIAGGVFVINAAPRFQSPLRKDITVHRNPRALVEHCVGELRAVSVRGGRTGYGLEAKCAIVVDLDNVDCSRATMVDGPPAPEVGDLLHYDGFLQTICRHFAERFAS